MLNTNTRRAKMLHGHEKMGTSILLSIDAPYFISKILYSVCVSLYLSGRLYPMQRWLLFQPIGLCHYIYSVCATATRKHECHHQRRAHHRTSMCENDLHLNELCHKHPLGSLSPIWVHMYRSHNTFVCSTHNLMYCAQYKMNTCAGDGKKTAAKPRKWERSEKSESIRLSCANFVRCFFSPSAFCEWQIFRTALLSLDFTIPLHTHTHTHTINIKYMV